MLRAPDRTRASSSIQAKLFVGQDNDEYEQEADRLAEQVLSAHATPAQGGSDEAGPPQKSVAAVRLARPAPTPRAARLGEQADGAEGAGAEASEVEPELESAIERLRGGGQPLPGAVRARMEQAFDADFGGVEVHTDAAADSLNGSLGARAFTTGRSLFFRRGEYNPHSSAGQKLLAHELAHVVQQNGNAVRRKRSGGAKPVARARTKDLSTASHVIQLARQLNGGGPGNQYQYRGQQVQEDRGGLLVNKDLATEVEALIPQKPAYGSPPLVEPAGWYWLGEHLPARVIAHTTTGTTTTLRRPGWVRFHVLNDNLGGSGRDEANLVPARQSDNLSSTWSAFETAAKNDSQNFPLHFYATVTYHAALPPNVLNPGNIHLGFFPNQIYAEYSFWNGQWYAGQNTTLTPQPPGTTAQLVQYELATVTYSELKALGVSDWLSYLIDNNRADIVHNISPITTKVDLYNLFTTYIPTSNQQLNLLNTYWPDLQNALNKHGGLELHIVLNNRGGTNLILGNSMINLFKPSKQRPPHKRLSEIQGFCQTKIQNIAVAAIFDQHLMGEQWDELVSESALYEVIVNKGYIIYKQLAWLDQNWTTDLFAPMGGGYILPVLREPIVKRTDELTAAMQAAADDLSQKYTAIPFVQNNAQAQQLVGEYYNQVLAIGPNQHQNDLQILQKVVAYLDGELGGRLQQLYDHTPERQFEFKTQDYAQQLNEQYYSDEFVRNNPEAQGLVGTARQSILNLTPQSLKNSLELLGKVVGVIDSELRGDIEKLKARVQEEERKRREQEESERQRRAWEEEQLRQQQERLRSQQPRGFGYQPQTFGYPPPTYGYQPPTYGYPPPTYQQPYVPPQQSSGPTPQITDEQIQQLRQAWLLLEQLAAQGNISLEQVQLLLNLRQAFGQK